jgi:serine/alanine adding enzyme
LGTPVYSLRFFREVMVAFPGSARIVCVLLGSRPVAAALVLWHRQTLEVPWASSLRSFNHLCANVLLYWNAVSLAIDQGLRFVDLGRSTPSEGTYNFKRQWGASPVPLVWEYWLNEGETMPDLSPHNPKFRHAIAAWQHLPVGLTRMLGPAIVRNLP